MSILSVDSFNFNDPVWDSTALIKLNLSDVPNQSGQFVCNLIELKKKIDRLYGHSRTLRADAVS